MPLALLFREHMNDMFIAFGLFIAIGIGLADPCFKPWFKKLEKWFDKMND